MHVFHREGSYRPPPPPRLDRVDVTDITDTVTVEHTAWDYICLEISHQKPNSKKYFIGDTYRLPNEIVQDVNIFTDEFSTYLSLTKNRKRSSFICRDFIINALLMDAKQPYNNFYDCVTEKSFSHKKKLYLRGYKINLIH